MPILIAAITQLAPPTMKGTLMGFLYFSLGFSGYFAGIIGRLTAANDQYNQYTSLIYYQNVYIKIGYLAFIVAMIIFGIALWSKRRNPDTLSYNKEVITM